MSTFFYKILKNVNFNKKTMLFFVTCVAICDSMVYNRFINIGKCTHMPTAAGRNRYSEALMIEDHELYQGGKEGHLWQT